jgi:hypothetical protein
MAHDVKDSAITMEASAEVAFLPMSMMAVGREEIVRD